MISTEQRAKELTGYELAGCADRAGLIVHNNPPAWMRAEDWERFAKEVRKSVAAALAACARERDQELLKAAKAALAEMEDYERHLQLQVFSMKEALRAALERAVGEKAE